MDNGMKGRLKRWSARCMTNVLEGLMDRGLVEWLVGWIRDG